MILDYLVVLFRHLKKQAGIAVINILSYGFGLAACLVLIQYIYYETSYDKFYSDHESVYRISTDNYYSGVYQNSTAFSFLPIGPELKNRYPEVQAFTVVSARLEVVTAEDKSFFEKRVLVADTGYFKVFAHDLVKGTSSNARPNDIFISESMAAKYFGADDPVGKSMKVFRNFYSVKGVFRDLPATTHLKFDILCLVALREDNDWNVPHMHTYIKLRGDAKEFSRKLASFSEEFSEVADQQSEGEYSFQARLQPLTSIHLKSALLDELEINGRQEDIYVLSAVAVMILIITCFNYVNLTNATNSVRSKERFVRKIHGASYLSSVSQHVVESLALNTAGFAIALAFLLVFATWIGPHYDFPSLNVAWTANVTYALATLFIVALVASGIIPAILTSSPAIGRIPDRAPRGTGFTRNIAFVQFTVSCVLISGALVVLKQVRFMKEGDRGFSDRGVMALEINPLRYQVDEGYLVQVKNDLEKMANIEKVSFSSCVPGEPLINTSVRLSADPVEDTKNSDVQVITSDYFSVYGMEIVKGRMFTEDNPGDLNAIVVNEALAAELTSGLNRSILNEEVTIDWYRMPVNFKVVGIVKDYYHYSKKQGIKPMLFIPLKNSFSVFRISVKTSDKSNWKSNEHLIQKTLKEHLTVPFERRGMQVAFTVADVESSYNMQYGGDERFSKFLNAMTILAVVMAGIGLFSLASATTRKRTREVAIRKVCGARVADVSGLLSSYFFKLAGSGFVVAMPISYFLVQGWLNQFSTRIEVGGWFVFWPLTIMVGLVLVSISYFVVRLVLVNPTDHLRSE